MYIHNFSYICTSMICIRTKTFKYLNENQFLPFRIRSRAGDPLNGELITFLFFAVEGMCCSEFCGTGILVIHNDLQKKEKMKIMFNIFQNRLEQFMLDYHDTLHFIKITLILVFQALSTNLKVFVVKLKIFSNI